MKNLLLVIISAFFLAVTAHGQTDPNWIWAKKLDKNARNVKVASVDESGNIYWFGHFYNEVELGNGITLKNPSNIENAFIAVYDTNGIVQWAKQFIGINISDLSRDRLGNIYICGTFRDSATLGDGITINGPTNRISSVTAKLDKIGNVVWAKTPEYLSSSEFDRIYATSISTDDAGNSYIGGDFRGVYKFGDAGSLVHLDNDQMFVVRYNAEGEATWARYSTGNGSAEVTSLTVDSKGNSRIGGDGSGNNNFYGHNVGGQGADIFIMKVDSAQPSSSPIVSWKMGAGGAENDLLNDVAVDKEGNVFICGVHGRNAAFSATYIFPLSQSQQNSLYVAKYDSTGQLLWAQSTNGIGHSAATAIVIDNNGNTYVGGYFSGVIEFGNGIELNGKGRSNILIAKYDNNGKVLWVRQVESAGSAGIGTMVIDNNENLYVEGTHDSTITLGTTALPANEFRKSFLAKFSTQNVVGIFDNGESNNEYRIAIHPNPAHSTSRISFKTTAPSHTRLTLTDILGRQTLLKAEMLDAGEHSAEINTANFPAGIYVLTLEAEGQVFSQNVVIER